MDTMNHNNEEKNPIRKILKDLPEVKASPDFEQRLQRRIAKDKSTENVGFFGKIFQPQYIPAFSYSLMALIAVGVVSYYVFIRTGIQPPISLPSQEPPSLVKQKAVPVPDLVPLGDEKNDKSVTSESSSPKSIEPRIEESITTEHESSLKQNAEKSEELDVKDADATQAVQSIQNETKGIVSSPALDTVENRVDVQERSLVQPSTVKGFQMSNSPRTQNNKTGYFYPISPLDSLKQDSLRKIQNQLQQQKARSKKPE